MSKNKQIAGYQITKELARGGMGVVFQAYDPNFERKVAVKVLLKHFRNKPSFRARFEEEARMVAELEHPAIVPVYDLGEEWNRPFIVMRYMKGGSLKDRLQHGPLPFDESRDILIRLAAGLDKVHEKGIIHRDMKPANVLFDVEGQAYLADFGMAHLIVPNKVTIAGRLAYMAPEEQAGETLDQRSDIYSLGMVLLEMLTGPLPSAWQTSTPSLKKILAQLDSNANLPPGCDRVMMRALAKKKQDRFASAGEFAHAFKAITIHRAPSLEPLPVEPAISPIEHEEHEANQANQADQKPVPLMAWVILGLITCALLLYSNWCLISTCAPPANNPPLGLMIGFTPPVDVMQNGEVKSAEVGMTLYQEDLVMTDSNAEAVISLSCAENTLLLTVAEGQNAKIDCKDVADEALVAPLDLAVPTPQEQSVLVLPSFTLRSSGEAQEQRPLLLTPRNTLITDTQPTFQWQSVPEASGYRLSLNIPDAGTWQQETSETTLVYPADAPTLTSGDPIIVKLSTLEDDTLVDETFLLLIDETDLANLAQAEAEIAKLAVHENAKAYLLAQLYQQQGTKAAAMAQLEQITSSGQAISADLWQQLGDLYFEIELYAAAQEQYEEALSRAETNNNNEAQALARVGLGRTANIFEEHEKASQHLQQAEELYIKLQKETEADKVAQWRAEIEP